jgi:aminoglycoside 6'-N-acetyltransferase
LKFKTKVIETKLGSKTLVLYSSLQMNIFKVYISIMYQFKPLARENFKLLFQWLQNPHVKAWWDSENDWEEFVQRHSDMIENPLVFPHIVFKDHLPIGYINYWFVEEDDDFKPFFSSKTVGTDQFIGIPELIGKGIGPEFIRQFTNKLLSKTEIEMVITDPDPKNISAVRAYEKAGFKKVRIMKTSEGEIQLLEKISVSR